MNLCSILGHKIRWINEYNEGNSHVGIAECSRCHKKYKTITRGPFRVSCEEIK